MTEGRVLPVKRKDCIPLLLYRSMHERQIMTYVFSSEWEEDRRSKKGHRREIESVMSCAGSSFEQGIRKELVDLSVVI